MKKTSAILHTFYVDYLEWAEAGGAGHDFNPGCGLCSNLYNYCEYTMEIDSEELLEEMYNQFKAQCLNLEFPFDEYSGAYVAAGEKGTCHLNEKRIQWVKDRIKEKTQ